MKDESEKKTEKKKKERGTLVAVAAFSLLVRRQMTSAGRHMPQFPVRLSRPTPFLSLSFSFFNSSFPPQFFS